MSAQVELSEKLAEMKMTSRLRRAVALLNANEVENAVDALGELLKSWWVHSGRRWRAAGV